MKPGESKHTREQRVALVADWLRYQRQGGRKTEWCRDHQVPMPTLCGWLRQFETEARAKVASGDGTAPSPATCSPPDNPGLRMVEGAIADLPEVDSPRKEPETAEATAEPGGRGLMMAAAILALLVIGGVLLGRERH